MSLTLAFDVYGTLIDTHGVVSRLQAIVGDKAKAFSQAWRDKQLEYSFRRGLMKQYESFSECTKQALDYVGTCYNASLSEEQKQELLQLYRRLPAFDDVQDSLADLKAKDCRLYAFSNGRADDVETLLSLADIRELFLGVVSVDDVRTFKPSPVVYHHFLEKAGSTVGDTWLISSNPFDVIGAISVGMQAAWVRRSREAVFDPWDIEPTLIVDSLDELANKLV